MDGNIKQNLKGYDLRDRLGAGGFGAVYRAYQSTVGREVAIKIILPGLANQPEFIRRFEGEAQLVARLEHPHITPLYDYWRDPDGAYLVMRWLRGGSLRDALQNGPYALPAACTLLEQIAGALSLAHRSGVIHRDIKPGNILLDEDGNAYLTDFGIAKDLNLQSSNTQQDAIIGSLDYISPEQARSEPVTPRTDIYSLGVTLYEVITGEHPFGNISSVERLFKHINDPLPEITTLDARVSEAVNQVIQKATAKNPEGRYPDALAFAADFREAIGLNRTSTTAVELLTQREHEILNLIIDGLSNKEIAQKLTVTLGTVKWYVNQIYAKLGVRSRVQAIVRAREMNLIVKAGQEMPLISIVPTEDFYPENPYKGLRAFQSGDNQDFFGREKVTAKLVKRLGEGGESGRFVAVVGPSGSGKSSLVKAGLIPAVWRGELPGSEKWFVVEMLPGSRPLDELEIALTKVAANQAGNLHEHLQRDAFGLVRAASLILPNDESELVVVIDQFEEVFTLVEDEAARVHFLDLLASAVHEPRSRVRVVITLRADFYDRPLHYPVFGELVRTRLETIMPLSAEELERAITRPAERVGVRFEPGLVAGIIGDVNYQPGALPLLQYALTELFEQRKGRMLTREGYQAIGGTVGALARRAEELYVSLSAEGQNMVRQLFLRLVTLGEGTEDTRRRTQRSELLAIAGDGEVMEEIIDLYAEYRLFALDTEPGTRSPTVEVAHEALLREWERLRAWLNESREDIRQERLLYTAAADWEANGRDASYLLSGTRLEQAEAWTASTGMSLTGRERAFVQASVEARERQAVEVREQQIREAQLEQRSQTFLRGLVAVLLVAVVVALGLTGVAVGNANEAQAERDNTQNALATSQANFNQAEQQRLYLAADRAMDANAPGNVGMALGMRSLAYGYTGDADAAITRASQRGIITRTLTGQAFQINSLSYSPDGRLIATAGEGGALLYDAETGEQIQHLPDDGMAQSVRFSSDGQRLLTAGSSIQLWDLTTYSVIHSIPSTDYEFYAGFTPDDRQFTVLGENTYRVYNTETGELVTSYERNMEGGLRLRELVYLTNNPLRLLVTDGEGKTYLRDVDTGAEFCTLVEAGTPAWQLLSWTYDSPYAVLATADNIASAWNLETCTRLSTYDGHVATVGPSGNGSILAADLYAEGGFVITADNVGNAIKWDIFTGKERSRYLVNNIVISIDISPDGNSLVMTDFEEAHIWDLTAPPEPASITTEQFDHTYFPQFSPDGRELYIGGLGVYSRWSLENPERPIITYSQPIRIMDVAPDGQTAAIALDDFDTFDFSIYLIDVDTGEPIQQFVGHEGGMNMMDFSPDSARMVSASFDQTARIWDVVTGETLFVLEGHEGLLSSATFSPDGRLVATGSTDGTVRIWDAATGEQVRQIPMGGPVPFVSFSPDGTLVGVADAIGGKGYLIGVETGETRVTLTGHTDFVWNIRFSPDGQLVVTSSFDGTARVWDATTGEMIRMLDTGLNNQVNSAEFSPDGKMIVTGTEQDNRVYLWRVDLDEVIADYCARNPVELTEEQRQQYGLDAEPMCPEGA